MFINYFISETLKNEAPPPKKKKTTNKHLRQSLVIQVIIVFDRCKYEQLITCLIMCPFRSKLLYFSWTLSTTFQIHMNVTFLYKPGCNILSAFSIFIQVSLMEGKNHSKNLNETLFFMYSWYKKFIYCEWLNFPGVPIFMVHGGSNHKFQYQRHRNFSV